MKKSVIIILSCVCMSFSFAADRVIYFKNQCPYPVWFGISGGGQLNGCADDSDCDAKPNVETGTFKCDPAANNNTGVCFWKNPVPVNGVYRLKPHTGKNKVRITEHLYNLSISQPMVWSGAIAARTRCHEQTCETADCGSGKGACRVGKGFTQPTMQAEMTLQKNSDFYDITSINGLNVPISIEPLSVTRDPDDPYTCGAAGVTYKQTSSHGKIAGCMWQFQPPSHAYTWVAPQHGARCSNDNDCKTKRGEACGLTEYAITNNSAILRCGHFLGYWTAAEVCNLNAQYSKHPFRCTADAGNSLTFSNMYQCNAGIYANSCYAAPNQTQCCGCHNWQESPSKLKLPSDNTIIQQCAASGNGSSNNRWRRHALPTLIWYKKACTTNYVYPYDDVSSTFTCSNDASHNHVRYRVTFCPGRHTGAPEGVRPEMM